MSTNLETLSREAEPHRHDEDACCGCCAQDEAGRVHNEGCGDAACKTCSLAYGEAEEEQGEEAQWKMWLPIGAGALLFIGAFLTTGTLSLVLSLAAYLLLGAPVLLQAGRDIVGGQVFGESFLMGVATIGALALGEYREAVAVMLFYRIGDHLQELAVGRSRRTIRSAVGLRPDTAHVLRGEAYVTLDPAEVEIGERILVEPGERIPLDGSVLSGESLVDFSALTGESVPVQVGAGGEVMAGGINQTGALCISVLRKASDSAVSRVLGAVEDAAKGKPRLENFITRFARVYTPIVVGAAALLAVVPPLLGLGVFADWLHRALIFLVVSCPCALVVSVPLTFFAGLADASSRGILFKGANRMEQLAAVRSAVFDKTGTLTYGVFEVRQVLPAAGTDRAALLKLAASAEHHSPHPVANAIRQAAGDYLPAEDARELHGRGVEATVAGQKVLVGNLRLMSEAGVPVPEEPGGAAVYVAADGAYAGAIVVADALKPDAAEAVKKLNELTGFTAILTGDAKAPAEQIAKDAGVGAVFAQLLPEDKLTRMREIRGERGSVLFVGDGVNDAPVLMGADVGIAIGGTGTDMAVEAADVVLLAPGLTLVPESIRISRRTLLVARQNIGFALGIKVLVMILGALGLANMWMAVFADVGTTLLCVLNALRLLPRKRR